jgi:hypothetical protein
MLGAPGARIMEQPVRVRRFKEGSSYRSLVGTRDIWFGAG